MKRGLRLKIIALVLTVLAGFGYILFSVDGWRIGPQRYPLTVMLHTAGGIYTEADVTYRGVNVGVVTALDLQRNGVAVKLGINPGVKIPDDSTAAVRELTAAGEQYLDLVPSSPNGPYLKPGAVIGADRTSVPISIDATLIDFGQLLSSINPTDLQAVNRELAQGFGGAGPQFHALVSEITNLLDALRSSQPAQVSLQVGGNRVLRTALATNQQFSHFTASLRQLTHTVAQSNPNLNRFIRNGSTAVDSLHTLLKSDSTSLESFIKSFSTITDTAYERNPAIQALFQALPVFATNLAGVTRSGTVNSELLFNTDGTVCPYLPATEIPSPTQAVSSPNLGLSCNLSSPDLLQRGAAHAPSPPGG